jgi:hypothetical protein
MNGGKHLDCYLLRKDLLFLMLVMHGCAVTTVNMVKVFGGKNFSLRFAVHFDGE